MRYTAQALTWLRRRIAAEWPGAPDLPRALTMEWRLVSVRWLGIVSVSPALFVMHLPQERMIAAATILFFATVYNIAIRSFMQRRPAMFASGYLTTVADSVMNTAMVLVGGGFDSPFSYILFTVTISVVIPYVHVPALALPLFYSFADCVPSFVNGH